MFWSLSVVRRRVLIETCRDEVVQKLELREKVNFSDVEFDIKNDKDKKDKGKKQTHQFMIHPLLTVAACPLTEIAHASSVTRTV